MGRLAVAGSPRHVTLPREIAIHNNPIRRRDPSSVGFAATFSRKREKGSGIVSRVHTMSCVNLLAARTAAVAA